MKRNPARFRAHLSAGLSISNLVRYARRDLSDVHRGSRGAVLTSLGLSMILAPFALSQQAGDAHYFSGGKRVDLRANADWVAVKVKPGSNTAGVKAGMRNRLAVRNDVDGIENPVAGVVVQQIETRSPKFRTKALVSSDATAVEGVERKLRTFQNGNLAPVVDTGEFCVRFSGDVTAEEVRRRLSEVGATIVRPLGDFAPNGYVAVVGKDGDAIAAANALYGKPGVVFSHPNLIRPKKKAFVPNDTLYAQQWHLNNTGTNGTTGGTTGEDIKAERAWEITRGSSSIIVAVLDDGFDVDHTDFASSNKVVGGWDFVSNDSDARPARASDNHGTSCAGIAVANGNNGKGVSGVAPGCKFMPVRMLGDATDSAEAAAFSHAKNNGAHILSCSFNFTNDGSGFIPLPDVVYNAIDDAASTGRGGKGCVIIVAAGNDSSSSEFSGYNLHPKVIVVGASTNHGVKSSYSNFGPSVDVCAPGGPLNGDMMTLDRSGAAGYVSNSYNPSFNGTSAATPVVAGVAALILSKEPNLTRSQVRQRLIDSSDFIGGVTYDANGHHDWYGYGRVNAWKALTWNDNTPPTATIRIPGNNDVASAMAEADGTASDTGTGVYQVRVSLRDSLNRWWNWKTPGWSAPNAYVGDLDNHLALATITGGTWKITLPDLNNGSYRLHATAIDKADLESTTAVSDFNIDDDGPIIAFTTPPNNSNHPTPPTVGGVASDFIQDRRYSLFREADGLWYDFVTHDFTSAIFNGTSHVDIVPSGTGFWNYAMPAALDPGRYQVHAITRDTSGRFSGWTSRNFRVAFPPQVTVNSPQHGTGIQDLELIGGTVNDTSGMGLQNNQVNFTLYNNGSYWTGSSWTSTQTTLAATVSGGSWSYTSVPSGSNERSGLYYISAFTTDVTGATSASVSGGNQTNFRLDRDPPAVAITGPANGSTLTTSTYQFRGTATDVGGIQAVNAFIRRASDNAYWNGSGWGVSPIVLETSYNESNGEWIVNSGLPMLRGSGDTQLPNGTYNFIAIAIDNAGNYLQTDSVVTVDYHQIFNWTAGSHSDLNPYNNDFHWGNPANWSPNGVPDTEDIAIIAVGHVVRSTVSRTVYGFHMSLGALDFDNPAHSLTITKTGTWTSGTLEDAVFIQPTATFAISGGDLKAIGAGGVIHNFGAVTWAGPGLLRGNQNSTWNNKPGSSFTMLTDGDVFANNYGGNVFNNEADAVFIKTAGGPAEASTYIDEWTFNNRSKIECQQGTLHFNTTLNLNPGSNLAGAGRVLLNGTTNLATSLTSTGNPQLIGTLNGTVPTARFSGTNPFIWSYGVISGAFDLASGSVMELTTGDAKWLDSGAVFTNHGRVNWKAGLLRGQQNSTFNNESNAVFDAFTDGDIFSNNYAGNVFNNAAGALFIKSGKSAVAGATSFVDEWTFNNRGVIRSDDGVLQFHTALNLNSGGSIARSGALPARVISSHYCVLTGTTSVDNAIFETTGDWHGNLTEGTAGNGTIATVNGGIFEWSGGAAYNTVNIAANSVFRITGGAEKWIGGGAVINHHGNATWSGDGQIRGQQNSTFRNLAGATFTATTDADFTNNYGGNAFVNAAGATFNKTAGTDSILCHWAFNNAGLVLSSSGSLAMNGGGVSSGTFAPSAGGEIHFIGGQHDLLTNANCAGTGIVRVNGGTVHSVNPVNSNFTNGLLVISAGTVTSAVSGSFGVSGNVDWTGGVIGGVFNIAPGGDFSLDGGAVKWIDGGGVINNSGVATWNPPGLLRGQQNSTWNNKSGGSFIMTGDGDVFSNNYPGNIFNNEAGAAFIKTAGGAGDVSSYIDEWTFNNNGALECRQGTLHYYTTLNLGAGSNLLGAGRVLLNGTTNLTTMLASTGNPELIGTLNGNNPAAGFTGGNPFVWSSGEINGTFTLQGGSVMNLATGNVKQIGGGGVFNNFGRVNWKAGLLRGFQNSTFNNGSGAVFDAFTDGDVFANVYGGNVFNNKAGALFIKSGQSGTPDTSTFIDEWTFNNSGSIRSEDGLLRFHTALNFEAGSNIARSGSLPARVLSSHYFVLTGTTTVSNITFESSGDWHGNLSPGSVGNGTIATQSGGVFEWTGGTVHNTVNIAPGAAFSIAGGAVKQIGGGGILNNGGIATRTGTGDLCGYQNSSFINLPGGVFNVLTSAAFTNNYGGNRLTNSGVMSIGSSAGISPLHWSFTQTATGRLNLEIGGTNAATPEFDQLKVSGEANLAGTFGVSLINGFAPLAGTTFPVLTFGSRSGSIGSVQSPGLIWGTQYNPNNLTLVAKTYPTTHGEWLGYFFTDPESPDAQSLGDPDKDGLFNLLEYALGRDPHSGDGAGSSAGTVEIGEETYLTLTFTRPAGDAALTDVIYAGERSGSLSADSWAAAGVMTHSIVPVPGEPKEVVTLRSVYPVGDAAKEFLHLKVAVGQ